MKNFIKIVQWAARVLCIAAILFIGMFALDAFNPNLSLKKQLTDFIIHLTPSFFLLIILLIAWKKELIGGIIFLSIGLFFIPYIYSHNYMINQSITKSLMIVLMINFPFVITGGLFILTYILKRKLETY